MSGLLLLGGVLVAAMVPLLVQHIQGLAADLPGWLAQLTRLSDRWFNSSTSTGGLQTTLTSSAHRLAGSLMGLGASALSGTLKLLTVGLFTFYMVAEGPRCAGWCARCFDRNDNARSCGAWDVAIDKTGGYLYSRLLLAALSSVATFVVLTVLGVPFAVPLALWVGIVSQFIPVVGTYIALALPVLVALAHSPVVAVVLLVFEVVYQQFENYVLSPKLTARTMALHPAVAVGAVIAGGLLYGAIAAFLALPAARSSRRACRPI